MAIMATDQIFLTCVIILLYVLPITTKAIAVPLKTTQDPAHSQSNRAVSPRLFDTLEELSRIVDVSYCIGTTGVHQPFDCLSRCKEFPGFELITTWSTGHLISDSCGYIALSHPPHPKRILVAFRGTYSITDTIIDLSAYPQAYVPYMPKDGDDKDVPECSNCTVHAGFLTSWLNTRTIVLDHVSAAREQYLDYEVVLVGHSLGGAVAALAGLEMQIRGWQPRVTTFGEPKVGNREFVQFLDKAFNLGSFSSAPSNAEQWQFRRVTHANDPVPLLPFERWGYDMHAGEIFISKDTLPPSLSDVKLCDGNRDMRCIYGAESTVASKINALKFRTTCGKWRSGISNPANRAALISRSSDQEVMGVTSDIERHQMPFGLPWNLIPSKFRLWELFFAHRDYFWRLGLCVPGGDPSGWRLGYWSENL
ncbi:Alpha/Beta hydrolase protein [Aspergillus avenaceus]|uniref:feruloyl esterase n=1 Tax=Aspergillus avenaceus TaxID=36643 RepID=A0A5N6TLR2_ASPAV|nr:Alpha/Beta hydrolase protein [Aspergillus avenaceus]